VCEHGWVDELGAAPAPEAGPSRTKVALVAVPIVALVIMSNVGVALTTTWAEDHPLALVLLTASNRVLVLTTNNLDATSYYLAGTARLLLSDPLFFLLGMWYGDRAIQWVERKSKTYGEMLRSVEGAFGKAAYALVVIAPNNYICLIAGAAGMNIGVFLVLNVAGTLVRLYLIRITGAAFESPIQSVLDVFEEYRIPLLVASVALVVFTVLNDRRKGKGDIGTLREFDADLDDEPTTTAFAEPETPSTSAADDDLDPAPRPE
jgi:membrane protein DedA with SNARE-associated domain